MTAYEGERSRHVRELRERIESRAPLWGWGTDAGLIPWEDREGRIMVVLWTSAEQAEAENSDEEAATDERAVRHDSAVLLEKVDAWTAEGVEVFGLEARHGWVLLSLSPGEFRQFLLTGRADERHLP